VSELVRPARPAETEDRPHIPLPPRRLTLVTGSLLLSQMLVAFDTSIVTTAMPRIVTDLASLDLYAWVTTANLVTLTTVIPIAGKLGDLFGRKRFIQVGIVGFIVASMLAGASQSMAQLLVARAIQGVFGGFLIASSIASLADLYLPATRARMHGVFMSVAAFASISGPILGGILTDQLGWRAVFYFNVPLGILAAVAIAIVMRGPLPTARARRSTWQGRCSSRRGSSCS
jgi:MFS family permease